MIQQAPLGLIDKQILWNRLIAVVEEQAQTPAAHGLLHHRA